MTLLALFSLLSLPCRAHDYPIKPVHVVLRVEPDRVVADIRSDSIYWIEEVVGLHPMPPDRWPAEALADTQRYVNEHLRLSAGGKPLQGRLIEASYVQRPWQVNETGTFILRMTYPPVPDGSTLSGLADFFEDYRQERLGENAPILPTMIFKTDLHIPGRRSFDFQLSPEQTTFSAPADQARRTRVQRLAQSLRVGIETALGFTQAWTALAALALSLGPALPRRAWGLLALTLIAACFPVSADWLPWAAGLGAGLAAGRWLPDMVSPWLEAAACAALGASWSSAAMVWLPRAQPGLLERSGGIAGELAAAAALITAGVAAVAAERRHLATLSESRAEELFARRRRLAATALLIVSGYGLAQAVRS